MVYPPMGWTRFAPSAQPVGGAPRVERARNDHLLSARPWVGLKTSDRTLTLHFLSAHGLDTRRARRPTRGRRPRNGTRSKRSPLLSPPMGWTQHLREKAGHPLLYPPMGWTRVAPSAQPVGGAPGAESARNDHLFSARPWVGINTSERPDPPYPIRPWVGHVSRQAPNPWAAPRGLCLRVELNTSERTLILHFLSAHCLLGHEKPSNKRPVLETSPSSNPWKPWKPWAP